MYGLMIKKYYVKVEKGMLKKDVIGGPVYSNNSSDEIIGRIIDYNSRNGFMKIEMMMPVDYKELLKIGIPLSSIIFNNIA